MTTENPERDAMLEAAIHIAQKAKRLRDALTSIIEWTEDDDTKPTTAPFLIDWYERRMMMIRNAARAPMRQADDVNAADLIERTLDTMRTARQLIDEAITTHIYDTDNGDTIPTDCVYTATVRTLDALIAEYSGKC